MRFMKETTIRPTVEDWEEVINQLQIIDNQLKAFEPFEGDQLLAQRLIKYNLAIIGMRVMDEINYLLKPDKMELDKLEELVRIRAAEALNEAKEKGPQATP